jgi:hypothetical protein
MCLHIDHPNPGLAFHWHLRIRAASGQRVASRVLQIFETQAIAPSEFRSQLLGPEIHLNVIFLAEDAKARRIGMLLRRVEPMQSVVLWACPSGLSCPGPEEVAVSLYAERDHRADTNPESEFWASAPSVTLDAGPYGEAAPGHHTDVRLRWTRTNLYFLFVCNYQTLSLRAGIPVLDRPTPELWKHDVAEVFIDGEVPASGKYCEFELSPRGEWLDLAIQSLPAGGISGKPLDSRFISSARLEENTSRWYGFLCVPSGRIVSGELRSGDHLSINFFRSQGNEPVELCWRPTRDASFHVPSAFGALILAE